jgi:hypothetical protein
MEPNQNLFVKERPRSYVIPKASVLAGDTNMNLIIARVVDDLRKKHDLLRWDFSISGYETDKRNLAEIPEVRDWCTKVYAKTPYLPLIMTDPTWYLLCVFGKAIGKESSGRETLFWIDSETLRGLLLEQVAWLGQFAREYQLSSEEMEIVLEKGGTPVATILHDWAAQAAAQANKSG